MFKIEPHCLYFNILIIPFDVEITHYYKFDQDNNLN